MKTVEEKIAVMQAALSGAEIEYKPNKSYIWGYLGNPAWNWGIADYRVKPETLKEAVKNYCIHWGIAKEHKKQATNTFEAGAEWQKKQENR